MMSFSSVVCLQDRYLKQLLNFLSGCSFTRKSLCFLKTTSSTMPTWRSINGKVLTNKMWSKYHVLRTSSKYASDWRNILSPIHCDVATVMYANSVHWTLRIQGDRKNAFHCIFIAENFNSSYEEKKKHYHTQQGQ